MVRVRPAFVMAATQGKSPSSAELSLYGMQLVNRGSVIWAKKGAWFRNIPYTATNPHLGQAETRVHFGELASSVKGRGAEAIASEIGGTVIPGVKGKLVMVEGEILPPVAAYLKVKMRGYKAPHRLSPEEYPSKKRRTFHTVEELRKIYGI